MISFNKNILILNNQWIKDEIKREKNTVRQTKMEIQYTKAYVMQQKQF